MKKSIILVVALCLLLPLTTSAQRNKRQANTKKNATPAIVEEPESNPLLEKMLPATERIVFVDSIVVSKDDVLKAIHINPEEGRLTTYDKFFKKDKNNKGVVYVNELGNRCIFSKPNSNGNLWLYSSDIIGNQWSEPQKLKGLENSHFKEISYPYLMPDGITLYFAARGKESLGGFDIYRTRLDIESGRYLKPENIGMPFSSENDDFLFVIDEQNQLGYFATTRRQPRGKVCVYTFIPNEIRRVYDIEALGEEYVSKMAAINSIADSWGNGTARKAALKRIANKQAKASKDKQTAAKDQLNFYIDDEHTYTDISQFSQPQLFREWTELRKKASETETILQRMRSQYAAANASQRTSMKAQVLSSEQRLEDLQQQILNKEKEIRNAESITSKE